MATTIDSAWRKKTMGQMSYYSEFDVVRGSSRLGS